MDEFADSDHELNPVAWAKLVGTFSDGVTAIDHTPQQLAVLRWAREKSRCEADFEYLASHYLRIKSKETIGFPTLKFNPAQQDRKSVV